MIVKKLSKTRSLIKPKISQKLKSGFVVLKPGEEVGGILPIIWKK